MADARTEPEEVARLRRAYKAMRQMRAKLDAFERADREPVAVVGMGCRLPCNINDPDSFWKFLRRGGDAIKEVPPERWDIDAYYDAESNTPGKTYCRFGSFVEEIDRFDPDFFGLSRMEVRSMDPQHRLVLETSWRALESSGCTLEELRESRTGVFVGITAQEYAHLLLKHKGLNVFFAGGNPLNAAAGRVSHVLGLQGPSMSIDTACSSSLVALHLACESLRRRECDRAIAGGVNVTLLPEGSIVLAAANMLARDGHCKTFDAAADGYVRGEGCGMLVLKRLEDARSAGDNIMALLLGSAVNHDGPSNGFTAPNGKAQQRVILDAVSRAAVVPEDVDYIEAHGTGTSLGDPIEMNSLGKVYGSSKRRERPLYVGSVKTNLGHLESASSVTGLMKVILSMQHGEIPPHLNFKTPNPHIEWGAMDVKIPVTCIPWQAGGHRRVAGISAFGASGTNAHMIVAEAPVPEAEAKPDRGRERPMHPLLISARSEKALKKLVGEYCELLDSDTESDLADICFSSNTCRSAYGWRLMTFGGSKHMMRERLLAYRAGEQHDDLFVGQVHTTRPKIAFMFTPPGPAYVRLIQELKSTSHSFVQILELYDRSLRNITDQKSLMEIEDHKDLTPVTTYAFQCAVSDFLLSLGVVPNILSGTGAGKQAAGYVSGSFGFEEGLRIISNHPQSASIKLHAARMPVISGRTGVPVAKADMLSHKYWAEFDEADDEGNWKALAGLVGQSSDVVWLIGEANPVVQDDGEGAGFSISSSVNPDESTAWASVLRGLCATFVHGGNVDWKSFDRDYSRKRVGLPGYPLDKQSYWVDGGSAAEGGDEQLAEAAGSPASEVMNRLADVIEGQLEAAGSTISALVSDQLAFLQDRMSLRDQAAGNDSAGEVQSVVFMFSGLGDHYVNMGRGLYEGYPVYRRVFDECCEKLAPHLGRDLREVVFVDNQAEPESDGKIDLRRLLGRDSPERREPRELDRIVFTHSALFAVEYAMARQLGEWGVIPDAMLGFSLGEYTAACLAGVISVDDVLRFIVERAKIIGSMPAGGMLTVPLSGEQLLPMLDTGLSVAAICTPSVTVVSGLPDLITGFENRLRDMDIVSRRLPATHAFHSAMMKPAAESIAGLLHNVELQKPAIPYMSNITGTWISADQAASPVFWARHAYECVRFADEVSVLLEEPGRVYLEIGPGTSLGSFVIQHPGNVSSLNNTVLGSLRNASDRKTDEAFIKNMVSKLSAVGVIRPEREEVS